MNICPGMHIHFMGISGIGMSGLARICQSMGVRVSGCDRRLNKSSEQLQSLGVEVHHCHSVEHIDSEVDILVCSTAVPQDNPEILRAQRCGVRVMSRGKLLAELADTKRLIAIAGAHGKTTTTAMAAQLLLEVDWDPTVVVGGYMLSTQTNAHAGQGTYMVAEADESDGSFLHLFPEIAIITNIDREHMNYYKTFDRLINSFKDYVERVAPSGILIACWDDPLVREHIAHPHLLTYGLHDDAHVTANSVIFLGQTVQFCASYRGRSLGKFIIPIPGEHNLKNALAIISLGLILDIPMISVRDALAKFRGTQRRFQMMQLPSDIWLVEDYAHHPAEIRATLGVDNRGTRHRLAVFQPHRFTRTKYLEKEFADCFEGADGVIVTDIYDAMEQPIPGVSGERLAGLIQESGHPCVTYVPKRELSSHISRMAQSGDTIFFLGAGDIGEMCHAMANRLCSSERTAC